MEFREALRRTIVSLAIVAGVSLSHASAIASTLSDATDSLRVATFALSTSSGVRGVDEQVIDDVVAGAATSVESSISSLRDGLSELSKSVSEVRSMTVLTDDETRSLERLLSEADELGRRGWSYTPPAEGKVTGIDIARAAVDVATSASPGPEYTDPSDPHAAHYVEIHDRFLAGEDYRACSVGTSTAIHWSGADPDFPRNTSSIVHAYCADSPRWKFVGHSPDKELLEPGDVFTSDYHTYLYVGNEVVRERFPDSDADVYTSGNQLPFLYWDSYEDRGYDVYRFVG